MANVVFKEKVKFDDKVVLASIAIIIFAILFSLVKALLASTWEPVGVASLVLFGMVFMVLFYLLIQLNLKLTVSDKEIKFKMPPFFEKSHKIAWEDMVSCRIVESPNMSLWHGSNVRFADTLWYSLTGRNGLLIETRDGKKYFVGCKNVKNLKKSLRKLDKC